jgi:hypothetical protein
MAAVNSAGGDVGYHPLLTLVPAFLPQLFYSRSIVYPCYRLGVGPSEHLGRECRILKGQ